MIKHIIKSTLLGATVVLAATVGIKAYAGVDVEVRGQRGVPATSDYDGLAKPYGGSIGLLYNDWLWARVGLEKGEDKFYGQPMGKYYAGTAEIGFRAELTEKLSVRIGGGYWFPFRHDLNPYIKDEMTYTHLVNRHYNEGRPIPLNPVVDEPQGFQQKYIGCSTYQAQGRPEHPNCFQSAYDTSYSLFFTAEVAYEVFKDLEIGINYRYLPANNYIAIGINDGRIYMNHNDPNLPGGWWMEDGHRNLSTVSATITYRF